MLAPDAGAATAPDMSVAVMSTPAEPSAVVRHFGLVSLKRDPSPYVVSIRTGILQAMETL
ncbi:hypothetical protein TUSST3_06760 [Streptomyces sp. TUS-ST3]|nr:hypothetical protein TUSST3_06760 [Streptomyces sp. TUS-ST3]